MILTSRTRASGTTCSGPIKSDDYDLRFFDCQSQCVRPGKEQQIIDNIEVGHCAGYNLVGRTEVEPLPLDPDSKKDRPLRLFALYPVLAPQEARGTGLIRYRYADPNRGDDSWDWNPGSRRVRRLNEALLSTATGAQTNDPDHYWASIRRRSSTITNFWARRNLLASVHAAHSPEVTCATDGDASARELGVTPYVHRRGDATARRQQSGRARQKDDRVP
jgi:hypothetical protein